MENTKFCSNCGQKIAADAQFCPVCGAQQSVIQPAQQGSMEPKQNPVQSAAARQSQTSFQSEQVETAGQPGFNSQQQEQNQQTATIQPTGVNPNGFVNKTINATKDMFQKYVEIEGRTSVADFWYAYLGVFILSLIVGLFTVIIPIVGMILNIVLTIPVFTLTIRRMHDINRPGIQFLLFLIPLVGVVLMIMWCIEKGTDGTNAFGPMPVEVTEAS